MRDVRGITLIALVITIIVLIILAGVSISLVLGTDGILIKTREAKEKTEQAKVNEEEVLNSATDYIDNQVKNIETKEYAPYDKPYMPNGFKYKEGSWNNGYTIIGVEENINDEFVWVPCVIDQSKVKEGDTVVTFGKVTEGKYNESKFGLLPTDTTIQVEDSSENEIKESVGKYGGFYIAKYEAGIDGENDNASLTPKTLVNGNVKPLSQARKGVWNYIKRVDAITVSKAMLNQVNTGVKSTLISGECWDTTLQWMVNASDKKESNKGYDINSNDKGWYSDKSSNKVHTTGFYAINNIYDMAGNAAEWTIENCKYNNSIIGVIRSGTYEESGVNRPVSYRSCMLDVEKAWYTFRIVLYK